MRNKLGLVTLVVSLTYMLLGLPAQIVEIWTHQSAKDISVLMFLLLAIQSAFWIAYGIQRKDWFVTIANSFGALFASIIVIEYLIFR